MIFKYKMTTIKDLINEKIINFEKFVNSIFADHDIIKKQISDLKNLPIEAFILYIKNYVRIHKDNMDVFFDKLIVDFKIDKNKIKDEDLLKFKKYFHFFNDIVDEL
jgi:hypothetical protein